MTQNKLPPVTKDLLDAFLASAMLWCGRLLGLLLNPRADQRKRRFTRLVQCAERWVECTLFITAAHRVRARIGTRRRIAHRVMSRPGVRITTGDNRLLLKSAGIKLRSRDLRARVARLLETIAEPERYIAYFMKRLTRGLCFRRLALRAPAAVTLFDFGVGDIPLADSS